MQTRDPMRERAQLEAVGRKAAQGQPAPTPALLRLKARSHGQLPRATPSAQVNHGGPQQKPLVR
jgi:hypothetical protein